MKYDELPKEGINSLVLKILYYSLVIFREFYQFNSSRLRIIFHFDPSNLKLNHEYILESMLDLEYDIQ